RGKVASLARRPNSILVLFNSSDGTSFWVDAKEVRKLFPATGSPWGDIFLDNATLQKLTAQLSAETLAKETWAGRHPAIGVPLVPCSACRYGRVRCHSGLVSGPSGHPRGIGGRSDGSRSAG